MKVMMPVYLCYLIYGFDFDVWDLIDIIDDFNVFDDLDVFRCLGRF